MSGVNKKTPISLYTDRSDNYAIINDSEGETATITRVGGKEETRRFLENLGFVVGAIVTVISKTGGNVIVNIKESRVAIGKDMATKIMV